MFRRTAQWIAYFIIVIALVCGLEVIGNLPVQSQSSLPLGTHLWLVLWCALGLMIPIFVWFSRTYPPAFIVCTTATKDDEARALLKEFNFPFRT